MAWYNEASFYHIYPLGLTGAPARSDGERPTARLRSLWPWVDHMQDLGFTALYIGPLFASEGHGYETTDYRVLDPRLGTNADLQAQFDTAYANPKVKGSVLYSERWMMTNPVNLNAVIAKQFDRLTLPPYLGHQPMVRPAAPQQVQADGLRLSWGAVPNCYYAVYQSHGHGKEATLVSITYDTSAQVPAAGDYFVTALTLGLNAESEVSAIVRCSPTPVR